MVAQRSMNDIIVGGFFELKKDKRKQIWDDLKRRANAVRRQTQGPVTMEQVLKALENKNGRR